MDVERIREALKWWSGVDIQAIGDIEPLLEAARLVVEAPEVWWCRNHESTGDHRYCDAAAFGSAVPPCDIARWLLFPPKEKT